MKIDWRKLLRVVGRLIVAAPAIKDAVEPVIVKRKHRDEARDAAGDDAAPDDGNGGVETGKNNRAKLVRTVATAALLAASLAHGSAHADGAVAGRVTLLHTYEGHNGLLIRLTSMGNPDACPGSAYLVVPNGHPSADFNKAALLTAQATGATVSLCVDGCFENYPRVAHLELHGRP